MREWRAVLAARAVQRVVPGGHDSLEVGNDSRIDLIRAGTRQIGGHFAVLGSERGDLPRRQRPDSRPLHPERRRAKCLPRVPFLLHETLGGDGDAAGGTGLGARGEPAAALALFVSEDGNQIGLQVPGAARDAWLEAAHEIRGDTHLDLRRQIVDPGQESIQETELFLSKLRRARLDGLGDGFLGHRQRRAQAPVGGMIAHDDGTGSHVPRAFVARVEEH